MQVRVLLFPQKSSSGLARVKSDAGVPLTLLKVRKEDFPNDHLLPHGRPLRRWREERWIKMKFAPSDDLQEGGMPSCRMGYEICLGQLQGLKHYRINLSTGIRKNNLILMESVLKYEIYAEKPKSGSMCRENQSMKSCNCLSRAGRPSFCAEVSFLFPIHAGSCSTIGSLLE
ncbi:hypothetical protein SLEP1_g25920 [Rubroshorea leprosula]|uniref:Uncharacterized protein n=1 Tax=Rubroshorea leprosula TaxID=152421 RepID=A0AAV5JUT2_9ROSI|nr:hypothetical protein SLEP1_g25920 [Rubroshorea leprosula]